jgi:sirohydrochlorin ferrochelatase
MTSRIIVLVKRQQEQSDKTVETHAERLRDREVAESVVVERYPDATERADLTVDYSERDTEEVYVVPMVSAQTKGTQQAMTTMAEYIAGSATFCNPVGYSPFVTDIIVDRASEVVEPAADVSLILISLGSSSLPYQRRMLCYHRTRLLEQTAYGEVTISHLLQDPTVECARHNVSNEHTVAVPVFVSSNVTTREEIPQKLGVDSGNIDYTDPLGTHLRLTDAIQAEVAKQRAIRDQRGKSDRPIFGMPSDDSHQPVTISRSTHGSKL